MFLIPTGLISYSSIDFAFKFEKKNEYFILFGYFFVISQTIFLYI